MTAKILIIEDDPSIMHGLVMNLGFEGYSVLTAREGSEGLRLAQEAHPDLVVLDVMLPKRDGFEIIRELRDSENNLPVVILSARSEESDKLLGLSLGADDYITKPFSLPELLARIRTVQRRQRRLTASADIVQFGHTAVDFATRRLTVKGQIAETTAREFDLLRYFMTHRDSVLTRSQILNGVWGADQAVTERTVDNFVARLRQKIELDSDAPRFLQTVRGVGYLFNIPSVDLQ